MKDSDRPLRIWMAIMIGSLVFSGAIMFWSPTITGKIAYDTGPQVEFNPDTVESQDYTSHLTTTAFFIIFIMILQVGAYYMIKNFYSHLE